MNRSDFQNMDRSDFQFKVRIDFQTTDIGAFETFDKSDIWTLKSDFQTPDRSDFRLLKNGLQTIVRINFQAIDRSEFQTIVGIMDIGYIQTIVSCDFHTTRICAIKIMNRSGIQTFDIKGLLNYRKSYCHTMDRSYF